MTLRFICFCYCYHWTL